MPRRLLERGFKFVRRVFVPWPQRDMYPASTGETIVLCCICDYDLRGTAEDGVCPECGAPVLQSIAQDPLDEADGPWAKRVSLGIDLALFGAVTLMVPFLHFLFIWMVVGGALLATRPEPGRANAATGWSGIRPVARLLAVLLGVVAAILEVGWLMEEVTGAPIFIAYTTFNSTQLLSATVVAEFTLFGFLVAHLGNLCCRVQSARKRAVKLRRRGVVIAVGTPAVALFLGLIAMLDRSQRQSASTTSGLADTFSTILAVVAVVVVLLLVLGLVVAFFSSLTARRYVEDAARAASQKTAADWRLPMPDYDSLPCCICGYDLQRADPAGVCPECATDVRRTILGNPLSAADSIWVGEVVRGLQVFRAALAFAVLLVGVQVLLFVLAMTTDSLGNVMAMLAAVCGVGQIMLVALASVGGWYASRPERGLLTEEPAFSIRRLSAFISMLSLCCCLAGLPMLLNATRFLAVPWRGVAFFFTVLFSPPLMVGLVTMHMGDLIPRAGGASERSRQTVVAGRRLAGYVLLSIAVYGLVAIISFASTTEFGQDIAVTVFWAWTLLGLGISMLTAIRIWRGVSVLVSARIDASGQDNNAA